jgi:MFS family permease
MVSGSPETASIDTTPATPQRRRGRPQLGAPASFWTAAGVVVVALWASGSPALIYPLYEQAWALSAAVITAIFSVYPVVLVVVLLIFGSLSDYIGRRATILAGLASILIGVLTFALAPSVEWLFVGRVFQGLGVGLALSPAGAALYEFDRTGKRASSVNTIAIAVGLSIATIVGGALVQYAPWPRELTFWLLLAVAVVLIAIAFFLPAHVRGAESQGRWRPRPIHVPRVLRPMVITSALAITATFGIGAVFISLGAQIVKDVLHTDNALIAGLVLAIGSAGAGVVSVLFNRMPARMSIVIGGLVSAGSAALLVASASLSSLPLFIAASLVFGLSSGLLFLGGFGLVNQNAPAHHRAGTIAVVYLVAYVGQGVTAIGLGLLATSISLRGGLDIVVPLLVLLSLATSLVASLVGRPRPTQSTPTSPTRAVTVD